VETRRPTGCRDACHECRPKPCAHRTPSLIHGYPYAQTALAPRLVQAAGNRRPAAIMIGVLGARADRSGEAACPVRTVQAWITLLEHTGRSSGPLFVRIDRHGRIGHVATAARQQRRSAERAGNRADRAPHRTAAAAGLPPSAAWSGHSLRRGFATETYRAGANPLRIARHGGWTDGGATLLGYIDEVPWASELAGVDRGRTGLLLEATRGGRPERRSPTNRGDKPGDPGQEIWCSAPGRQWARR
jgi:hypothetical protein